MGFNIGKAITGAITGGASGGWAGAGIGAALGGFSGDEAADAKATYNRQLNDSIMLWNMQNAYNTPLQQRKRLEEAGYNPNLWYTQGNTGNSGTISQPSYPSYSQGGNSALNNILSRLNVRSAKADVTNKEADAEYKQLQLDYLKARINAIKSGRVGTTARKILTPKQVIELNNKLWEDENPVFADAEKAGGFHIHPGKWMSNAVERITSSFLRQGDWLSGKFR